MKVLASILKFFGLLKPSPEQKVKPDVTKDSQYDAHPPIIANPYIPKQNQHNLNSKIKRSYPPPTETSIPSLHKPKSFHNFDSESFLEFINNWESTYKIKVQLPLASKNKEIISPLISTDDSEIARKQWYEIYVICPGCHIGGYMGCPYCSGAGGWYEKRYGIPPKNEIQKRSNIQRISENINRAADMPQWNPKLIKYVDESLDVLKNIASEPGAKELISKIERLKKEVNTRTLKNKLINKYQNNKDLEINIRNNNIFYAKGTLFKYSYNKFMIRSNQNELYDLPLNLFKDFLTKIIKSCSAMKTYNTYKFINKDIEDDLLKNNNKGFAVILLKLENATHYFYVSHETIDTLTQNIIEDKSLIKHIN